MMPSLEVNDRHSASPWIRETRSRSLRVDCLIENYFVGEGKGRAIESARNTRELRVEVSLRKDGRGVIIGLFADGNLVR
jgi:uncharacterized membrane-anchored protein